jgi:GntR family transcriptional regulator of vanillate catabolism
LVQGIIGSTGSLTEKEICAQLDMSRTPVRTALQTLAQEGLLDYQPQKGYRVRPIDAETVFQAYLVRAVLEGLACRTVASQGLNPEAEKELGDCVKLGARLLGGDSSDFDHTAWRNMNTRYHDALIVAAANPVLTKAAAMAEGIPLSTTQVIADMAASPDPANLRAAQEDHVQILHAILSRQGGRAEARMKEHILIAGELVRSQIDKPGEGTRHNNG